MDVALQIPHVAKLSDADAGGAVEADGDGPRTSAADFALLGVICEVRELPRPDTGRFDLCFGAMQTASNKHWRPVARGPVRIITGTRNH